MLLIVKSGQGKPNEQALINKPYSMNSFLLSSKLVTTMIHIQLYTYTCGNIVNTIMTNEHTSLEKYTSHTLFKMVAKGLCARGELETEQTATN